MVHLKGLNDRQREAVTHKYGPLLVLAGAGSGKTRVITCRIVHLLRGGVDPTQVLALSFTNKAAREVAARVRELAAGSGVEDVTVGTFHSLGLRILRQELGRLGRDPRFSLYGEGDQRAVIRDLLRDAGLPLDASAAQGTISFWKNRGLFPEDLGGPAADGQARALRGVYAAYREVLRAQNAVDFDDLLLLPLRIFRESPDCLHHWQNVFRHVLVDEYQDTNPVQFALLKELAGGRRNLCAVGDDDQAIYGWRGAEVGLILAFEEHFPGTRVVRLEENYRSTKTILAAAHAVVARIEDRRPKQLWTAADGGEPLGWIEGEDAEREAAEVAAAILADVYRSRRPWSDFAVLYRTNSQARPFEVAFRAQGIPHRVLGGAGLFDRKEVRDLLCYLKVLHNPRDEASLVRIANTPRRGLGPQTLLALKGEAERKSVSLRTVLAEATNLPPQSRAGAQALLALLREYEARFRRDGLTAEGLARFTRDSGLRAEIETAHGSPVAVERRLRLLEEVIALVPAGPRNGGKVDLGLFIEKLNLDPPLEPDQDATDGVRLLTLHGSKGLEFPVVFLVGLEEGLLPHTRDRGGAVDAVEEERRLCYVGMTRARERLHLCRAKTRRRHGVPVVAAPSRFLAEIPLGLTARAGQPGQGEEEQVAARAFFAGVREILR